MNDCITAERRGRDSPRRFLLDLDTLDAVPNEVDSRHSRFPPASHPCQPDLVPQGFFGRVRSVRAREEHPHE